MTLSSDYSGVVFQVKICQDVIAVFGWEHHAKRFAKSVAEDYSRDSGFKVTEKDDCNFLIITGDGAMTVTVHRSEK